jgi:hypothetical protein
MSNSNWVRRRPDGSAIRPSNREPNCVHPFTHDPVTYQPASACLSCAEGEELARWRAEWAAWLAEHPNSPEARYTPTTPTTGPSGDRE